MEAIDPEQLAAIGAFFEDAQFLSPGISTEIGITDNTERVLAIELFTAAQALEFRRPLRSSPFLERIHKAYRAVVPFIRHDEVMYPHIARTVEFMRNYELDL